MLVSGCFGTDSWRACRQMGGPMAGVCQKQSEWKLRWKRRLMIKTRCKKQKIDWSCDARFDCVAHVAENGWPWHMCIIRAKVTKRRVLLLRAIRPKAKRPDKGGGALFWRARRECTFLRRGGVAILHTPTKLQKALQQGLFFSRGACGDPLDEPAVHQGRPSSPLRSTDMLTPTRATGRGVEGGLEACQHRKRPTGGRTASEAQSGSTHKAHTLDVSTSYSLASRNT